MNIRYYVFGVWVSIHRQWQIFRLDNSHSRHNGHLDFKDPMLFLMGNSNSAALGPSYKDTLLILAGFNNLVGSLFSAIIHENMVGVLYFNVSTFRQPSGQQIKGSGVLPPQLFFCLGLCGKGFETALPCCHEPSLWGLKFTVNIKVNS